MNENKQAGERQPPLSVQFKEGYRAFFKGWLTNKYHPENVRGKEWQRGFDRGYFENLNRLRQR